MVVYRGMSGVIPADVKPGQVLHDKAYMSTGTDPEGVGTYTWDASGNEKIPAVRITVPAGTKAISQYKRAGGPGMESWTNQNREREVLLPRDSRIKVTGKDPDGTITAELQ
jgi:hypothetical protein